jgi:uncharacterized membrane protein
MIRSPVDSFMGIDLRCPGCGREAGEGARFCEWCGSNLVPPVVVSSPIVMQSRAPITTPMYIIIIGIVVILIGGVVYSVSWSQTMHEFMDDPFADSDPFDGFFDLMMLSYVIMTIGTILLFVGMILLVLNE